MVSRARIPGWRDDETYFIEGPHVMRKDIVPRTFLNRSFTMVALPRNVVEYTFPSAPCATTSIVLRSYIAVTG